MTESVASLELHGAHLIVGATLSAFQNIEALPLGGLPIANLVRERIELGLFDIVEVSEPEGNEARTHQFFGSGRHGSAV